MQANPIEQARATTPPSLFGRWRDRPSWESSLLGLALLCLAYCAYIALRYAGQPPLDNFSFRQAQTALSAYWLVQNGFSFAYETPVVGPPWSIPFEFPIYQYLASLVAQVNGCSLDAAGRVLSFVFLLGCLPPTRALTRSLGLSPTVFYLFAALLLSSPLYLYWGRSFMIETAAVFFCVAAIKYFVDLVQDSRPVRSSVLFLLMITLGILQKATTGLPVLAVLGIVYLGALASGPRTAAAWYLTRRSLLAPLYFGLPLLVGIAWTLYTDQVKSHNLFGADLTSAALFHWNWGTLEQRLSLKLYKVVIWHRMIERNLAGLLGLAILVLGLTLKASRQTKLVIAVSALFGLLPLFLFTNLHLEHDYYQAGNLVFLIFALAVSLGEVVAPRLGNKAVLLLIALALVGSNYHWFAKESLPMVETVFDSRTSRDFDIGRTLKAQVPPGQIFVAFGNDWSSTLAYLAERKSFTVPAYMRGYRQIARHPERFIGNETLGAVVACQDRGPPTLDDLQRWSMQGRHWKIAEVHGCYIALPDVADPAVSAVAAPAQCEGSLDIVEPAGTGAHPALRVIGWTALSAKDGLLPDKVFVTLGKPGEQARSFEAFRSDRPDVNAAFGQPADVAMGFSRLVMTDSLSGEFEVGVTRSHKGRLESCQWRKPVTLGAAGHE